MIMIRNMFMRNSNKTASINFASHPMVHCNCLYKNVTFKFSADQLMSSLHICSIQLHAQADT